MNGCPTKKQLSAWHDGELPREQALGLEAHIADCPACRAEIDALKALSRLVATTGSDMPGWVSQSLHRNAPMAERRRVMRLTTRLDLLAAAVLVLCLALVWTGGNGHDTTAAVPQPWELAAVNPDPDQAGSDIDQFTYWMEADLSTEASDE